MEVNRAQGDLRECPERAAPERAVEVAPVAPAADMRWPGGIMMLLIIVALGWPLVTLAAAVPTWLIADRDQGMVLAGVAAGLLLLRWAVGA
jgi:hypothetical protein